MEALDAAEAAASALAADLSARAVVERDRREAHEAARSALTAIQLRDGRIGSDLEALARDRRRLIDEREVAEADAATARRSIAAPVPARDLDLEAAVSEAERELAEAQAELGTLRMASQARGEELAALRRAEGARQAELETARRRLADAERRLAEAGAAATESETRRTAALERHAATRAALEGAIATEAAAATAREAARAAAETAEAERAGAADLAATSSAAVAAIRGRVDAAAERLAQDERRPIARAARQVGGRRVDDDLVAEPGLRAAVEAVLAERARGYLVRAAAIEGLATERGALIVEEQTGRDVDTRDTAVRRCLEAVTDAGGGRLVDAIQRDGAGAARRLLARAVWVPDLAGALAIQPTLPPGWVVVARDGAAVIDDATVYLGSGDGPLERKAEHARWAADLERAESDLAARRAAAETATREAGAARAALEASRTAEARANGDRRQAEEAERARRPRPRGARARSRLVRGAGGARRGRGGTPSLGDPVR